VAAMQHAAGKNMSNGYAALAVTPSEFERIGVTERQ